MPAQHHRLRLLVGVAATLATSVCTQEEAPYPVVPGETGPPLPAVNSFMHHRHDLYISSVLLYRIYTRACENYFTAGAIGETWLPLVYEQTADVSRHSPSSE